MVFGCGADVGGRFMRFMRFDPVRCDSSLSAARRAAAGPPVDHERVAILRAAIANGDYRPAPQAIADKMLGAKQEWIAK